jgi:hypothetical protein
MEPQQCLAWHGCLWPSVADCLRRGRIGDGPARGAAQDAPELFSALASIVPKDGRLESFTAQHCMMTLWSFASAGHPAPEMFDAIARTAIRRDLEHFAPQALASVAWAFATLNHPSEPLFNALRDAVERQLEHFNRQGLANIAWAFAVADHDAPSLFGERFLRRCAELRWPDPTRRSGYREKDEICLNQLHQWQLWQRELGSEARLPDYLAERCYNTFRSRPTLPSGFQREVLSSLLGMGLIVREEVVTAEGYSIDMVVDHKGLQLGIEVDGPSHFCGYTRTPAGATLLKRRQLSRLGGWRLISVPYWEWSEMGRLRMHVDPECEQRKIAYMREALERALGAPLCAPTPTT